MASNKELDENILWHGHHSILYKIKSLIFGSVLALFGAWYTFFNDDKNTELVAILALILGTIIYVQLFLHHIKYHYLVSNRRISIETGILSKTTTEIPIEDVEGLHIVQGKFERIANVGSLKISSSAQQMPNVFFHGVSNPEYVKNVILKAQRYQPL